MEMLAMKDYKKVVWFHNTFVSSLLTHNSISVLHIEWCKSQARARRWSEEVALLLEEMRRVTAFLDWQAG